MSLELVSEVSIASLSTLMVLLFTSGLMMAVIKARKKLKKRLALTFSLAVISIVSLIIPDLFSRYAIDPVHVSIHVLFSVTLLLCALLLQYVVAGVFASFSSRIYDLLEISVFDRLQYVVAGVFASFSSRLRKTHTGNLNFNMLALLLYLLFSLILFHVFDLMPKA